MSHIIGAYELLRSHGLVLSYDGKNAIVDRTTNKFEPELYLFQSHRVLKNQDSQSGLEIAHRSRPRDKLRRHKQETSEVGRQIMVLKTLIGQTNSHLKRNMKRDSKKVFSSRRTMRLTLRTSQSRRLLRLRIPWMSYM